MIELSRYSTITYSSHTFDDGMLGTAGISGCGTFRYVLSRSWDSTLPRALVIMLNPSRAAAAIPDATVRKLCGFGKRLGWGSFVVVNLFAFRSTDPADLKASGWPVGPANDAHIRQALSMIDGPVICAWGSNVKIRGGTHGRVAEVMKIIGDSEHRPQAFRLSKDGTPWHPLYIPYDEPLVAMPE